MKFKLLPEMTFNNIMEELKKSFPNYKIELLKNPVARFEYIQVTKSAYVGVWIRIFEKKEIVLLMGCIPSTIARLFLGGLLVLLFLSSSQKKVKLEIKNVLENKFKTSEIK